MNQPTLFPPPTCTCHPLCDDVCRGQCGCINCQIDCGEVMADPVAPRPLTGYVVLKNEKVLPTIGMDELLEIARRVD